jgi:hypothetical protein
VTVYVTLCGLCGCWVDRRGGVGLSVGPTISESYQLSGVVTALGEVERPLADARVAAVYLGTELAVVRTDVGGRLVIDVDRSGVPAAGAGTSSLAVGPVTMSSSGGVVLHNYAAIPTHEHWTVELHVGGPNLRAQLLPVDVLRDVHKAPIKVLLLRQ